jgi:hypothetical protein
MKKKTRNVKFDSEITLRTSGASKQQTLHVTPCRSSDNYTDDDLLGSEGMVRQSAQSKMLSVCRLAQIEDEKTTQEKGPPTLQRASLEVDIGNPLSSALAV